MRGISDRWKRERHRGVAGVRISGVFDFDDAETRTARAPAVGGERRHHVRRHRRATGRRDHRRSRRRCRYSSVSRAGSVRYRALSRDCRGYREDGARDKSGSAGQILSVCERQDQEGLAVVQVAREQGLRLEQVCAHRREPGRSRRSRWYSEEPQYARRAQIDEPTSSSQVVHANRRRVQRSARSVCQAQGVCCPPHGRRRCGVQRHGRRRPRWLQAR